MRHELHGRRIFVGIALTFHRQIAAVADDMRVCENSITTYDKPRADPALDPSGIPRCFVIWFHRCGGDPDQALLNRAIWFWRRNRDWDRNHCLRRRGRPRRTCGRRRWRLWRNRRGRRGVLLCVRHGSSQQANANKNESTLHRRKLKKLKRSNRKSNRRCHARQN